MTQPARPIDFSPPLSELQLNGAAIDPLQVICLPNPTTSTAAAAVAALTNSRGGFLLLGAEADQSGGSIRSLAGIRPGAARALLDEALRRMDPPLDDLVSTQTLTLDGGELAVISVRQNAQPPVIDASSGQIYVRQAGRTRPISGRSELDALYNKGRSAARRAERLIESQLERLSLAQFGHYGIAVVACTAMPSAAAYLWACNVPEEFADPDDGLVQSWDFSAADVHVRAGECELRKEREATGILRVSRAGSVVAGEISRRPPRDKIGSAGELAARIGSLVDSAARILSHDDGGTMIAHLYCDGLKGVRLSPTNEASAEPSPCLLDVLNVHGPVGDAGDADYRLALRRAFVTPFLIALGVEANTEDA